MKLKEYESKRNFDQTPEPKPGPHPTPELLTFVVQKHSSRRLHYDLRLELDGVLKSWAVPRGPTLDPAIKRLAVMVEDHPLEYRTFEGVIPQGSYGAGTVIVWDKGVYYHPAARDRTESEQLLREGLKKGHITFVLEGQKLKGEFALIRTRMSANSWLLLKTRDRYATADDVLNDSRSVASSQTLEDVYEQNPDEPPEPEKTNQIRLREAIEREGVKDAPKVRMPDSLRPMLATEIEQPFDDPDWLFEVKWDGYRAVAVVSRRHVYLNSRNRRPLESKFPQIVDALRKLEFEAILDGEIVVVDDQGRPDFQKLQEFRGHNSEQFHLIYYIFDIPYLQHHDLTSLPLLKRKKLLEEILPRNPNIRFSGHVLKEGIGFFRAIEKQGIEGMMAKRVQSAYRPGTRSRDWLKVKTHLTQEGVIAGFTQPRGSRKSFGALVLGAYQGKELTHIGQVGSGFNAGLLKKIHEQLTPLIRTTSPFKNPPETDGPVTWVRPKLVCEVVFHGWTKEGLMRQPVFSRMRPDKAAREVVQGG
jgi:bifunctional non-homologous end joining protein LigD